MSVRVQTGDFDISEEIAHLRIDNPKVGAVACFVGTVRDMSGNKKISAMELEHYAGMTESVLRELVDTAKKNWNIFDALIIHRVGKLEPTDQIVLVAVTSAHRQEAFSACEFLVDKLKISAPLWKKEYFSGNSKKARWVTQKASDEKAGEKWDSLKSER